MTLTGFNVCFSRNFPRLPVFAHIRQAACRVETAEALKLYGFASSYVQRILASGKQVASQERYDFEVSNYIVTIPDYLSVDLHAKP